LALYFVLFFYLILLRFFQMRFESLTQLNLKLSCHLKYKLLFLNMVSFKIITLGLKMRRAGPVEE
jgi:hypothetical protein